MKLIIGGAYQGKLEYALESSNKNAAVHECNDATCDIDYSKDIINGFHMFVLACVRNGVDIAAYIDENLAQLRSKTIICDDISCGVVPMDKDMRQWREAVGRSCGQLTRHSDEVVRVFCGLGTRIK